MFDILDEIKTFKTYNDKYSAIVIQEEIEVLMSNHNVTGLSLSLVDLTILTYNKQSVLINKLILEFCFYILYINDVENDELLEIFDDFINDNKTTYITAIPHELKGDIVNKIKNVRLFMDKLNTNTLQFIGWLDSKNIMDYTAGFITGFEDG